MAGTKTQNAITLKGSTQTVTEFFEYGINSILYQRGIYPPESFTRLQNYGLTLLVTTDDKLKTYLQEIIRQIREWLLNKTVQKVVVVVKCVYTSEVLERWQFNIECDKSVTMETKRDKSDKSIKDEIRNVIRQITASVTFLPLLETACAFDILVYTDTDVDVPEEWGESGPHFVINSEEVRLRSFSTSIHKVDTMVAYKKD